MIPHAKILAATDLGPAGDEAIQTADAWCKRLEGSLAVVHARPEQPVDPMAPQARDEVAEAEAERRVRAEVEQRVQALTGRAPHEFTVSVGSGRAADVTLQVAEDLGVDLLVLGGRDSGETRWVFGSVAEGIVMRAKVPVLVARPHQGAGPVVAATDFSESSLPAVRAGHALSRMLGVKVTLVHCMPKGTREDQVEAERARLQSICDLSPEDDDQRILLGPPAESLVSLVEELDAALLIVASSGKTGMQRFMLGSVAERLVRSAPCSVLVVRLR